MYKFEDAPTERMTSRRGPRKCAERLALDELPIGKMVRFKKGVIPDGSIRAWAHMIGKERGIRFSVHDAKSEWHVVATSLVPTP